MWIMVAGPYRTGGTPEKAAENLRELNRVAHAVLELGHVPIIGVNLALPIISAAGEDRYDAIMLPLSLSLVDRCDAVLRVGGPSHGADAEARRAESQGKPIYRSLAEVPRLAE